MSLLKSRHIDYKQCPKKLINYSKNDKMNTAAKKKNMNGTQYRERLISERYHELILQR
ncbi:MAG: hypothetical protein KAH14_02710 [Clostridiales bacterium]|nr:hypothetical protein [Clostridiales bacterium]